MAMWKATMKLPAGLKVTMDMFSRLPKSAKAALVSRRTPRSQVPLLPLGTGSN